MRKFLLFLLELHSRFDQFIHRKTIAAQKRAENGEWDQGAYKIGQVVHYGYWLDTGKDDDEWVVVESPIIKVYHDMRTGEDTYDLQDGMNDIPEMELSLCLT